ELAGRGVGVDAVVEVAGRRTPAKRRVVADRQMIARLDEEPAGPVPPLAREALLAAVDALARASGLVLVCDYGLGVLCDEVLAGLAELRPGWTCPVVVDAHEPARWGALRPTAVTPNWEETLTLLGGEAPGPGADR